jgi:hypothetical protein
MNKAILISVILVLSVSGVWTKTELNIGPRYAFVTVADSSATGRGLRESHYLGAGMSSFGGETFGFFGEFSLFGAIIVVCRIDIRG